MKLSLFVGSAVAAVVFLCAQPSRAETGAEAVTAAKTKTTYVMTDKPSEVVTAVKARGGKEVVTFIGFSGAGYEDNDGMIAKAKEILGKLDSGKVIVNIGGTAVGIGQIYSVAKKMGFETLGIVSSKVTDGKTEDVWKKEISPDVDRVFVVTDDTWGGRLPSKTDYQLASMSKTSRAMVAVSDHVIGLGGGDVGRDELKAAILSKSKGGVSAVKTVEFYPFAMNHKVAVDKATSKGKPVPTDFRGSAEIQLAGDKFPMGIIASAALAPTGTGTATRR